MRRIASPSSLLHRLALALGLLATAAAPACYGPFAATRRIWHWNLHWENEWAREGLFLVTGVLTPVYALTMVGDVILFNSVWFWTGESWIDEPGGDHAMQAQALQDEPALDGLVIEVAAAPLVGWPAPR